MAVQIKCPSCKQMVPFGRLFCTFCGAKLELTPENVQSRLTVDEAFGGVKRWVIRLVMLAIVAGAIGVFFWPMEPQGQVGNSAHATYCEQKIAQLRSRTLNGQVFVETFQENEVNALLAERLTKTSDTSAGSGFQLTEVNMTFVSGKVIVNTRMTMSKLELTYELEIVPSITSQGFKHEVTAMRIGHVPIPGFAQGFLSGRALNVFSDMQAEADLMGKMKQLNVDKGVVRLSNQAR